MPADHNPPQPAADNRPCIVMVGPWPPVTGGVTTFMLNVERDAGLAAQFRFVRHTTARPPKRDVVNNWGYHALFAGGPWRALVAVWLSLWHFLIFPARLIANRAQIVQIQASDYLVFWESIAYVLASRALGRWAVLRIGGSFDRFYSGSSPLVQRVIRWAVALPHRLVVQSDYWRRFLADLGRADGVLVLPNWVPETLLADPDRPQKGTAADSAAVTAVFICGNEALRRGAPDVLAAWHLLADRYGVDAVPHLRIIAAPEPLRQECAAHPAASRLAPLPFLSHAEAMAELRKADLFLLPSHGEGFPNSLIEAMAAGLPSIATPVGAIPEVLQDGVQGILIPVGDPVALADAVARLAGDNALRLQKGKSARAYVEKTYTDRVVPPRLASLYHDLLNRNR